jgi:hypothetical protein
LVEIVQYERSLLSIKPIRVEGTSVELGVDFLSLVWISRYLNP